MIKKARAENKHVDGYALGRWSQIYQRGKHRPGGCRDEMLEVNVHVCWCLRFTCQIYHVAKFDQTSSSGPHIVQNSGTWAVRSFFFFLPDLIWLSGEFITWLSGQRVVFQHFVWWRHKTLFKETSGQFASVFCGDQSRCSKCKVAA